jgi:hypothetical protein
MPQMFANAARATLASGITNVATSITLATGKGALFPVADTDTGAVGGTTKWFRAVLDDGVSIEVVYVRTHTASSDSFTNVQRGQEGTTAVAWSAGAVIGLRVTAADMEPRHAMSVHRSTGLSVGTGWLKLTMNATGYDTGAIWSGANTRATPTRPGYYLVTCRIDYTTACLTILAVYKNGSEAVRLSPRHNSLQFLGAAGSALIYCNGTDYLEPYAYFETANSVSAGAAESYFQLVGPL